MAEYRDSFNAKSVYLLEDTPENWSQVIDQVKFSKEKWQQLLQTTKEEKFITREPEITRTMFLAELDDLPDLIGFCPVQTGCSVYPVLEICVCLMSNVTKVDQFNSSLQQLERVNEKFYKSAKKVQRLCNRSSISKHLAGEFEPIARLDDVVEMMDNTYDMFMSMFMHFDNISAKKSSPTRNTIFRSYENNQWCQQRSNCDTKWNTFQIRSTKPLQTNNTATGNFQQYRKECRHGSDCYSNGCKFKHPHDEEKPLQTNAVTRSIQQDRNGNNNNECRYGSECNRKGWCTFKHPGDKEEPLKTNNRWPR
jgi:hypothetical protein